MRKLKRSKKGPKRNKLNNKRPIEEHDDNVDTPTSTTAPHVPHRSNSKSNKGELYKARHNYVQTFLQINRKGKRQQNAKILDGSKQQRRDCPKQQGTGTSEVQHGKGSRSVDEGSDDDTDVYGSKKSRAKKKDRYDRKKLEELVPLSKLERRKIHYKEQKQRVKERLKEKQEEKNLDFGQFKDEVKFGEVVQAPPKLTAKPRGTQPITNKPGQRALLLKSLTNVQSPVVQSSETPKSNQSTASITDSAKVKRKHLTLGQRRIIETEQKRVIDAYRTMKKK